MPVAPMFVSRSDLYHFVFVKSKGVGMIRVNFGPISETVYIDKILNTIIKRLKK
jgi:hypothetical protein